MKMKELGLNKFLGQADDYIINAAMGGEFYAIETTAGKAVVISEDEYRRLMQKYSELKTGNKTTNSLQFNKKFIENT